MTLVDRVTFGLDEQVSLQQANLRLVRHEFLRALHSLDYRDMRAFREGDDGRQFNFPVGDFESVDGFALDHRDRNVYFGVAARATSRGGRLENCSTLAALFVEIDFKDHQSAEIARLGLDAFPVRPSIIVLSGGGIHAYWPLTEPLDLTRDRGAEAKALLVALATAVGGDLRAAEPARVLRLPGTLNHKYSPPRLVTVERFSAVRHSLADLRAVLPPVQPQSRSRSIPSQIPSGSRNDLLYHFGCRLRRAGSEEPEIAAALQEANRGRCHPPLDEREVANIASSAARQPIDSQSAPPKIALRCLADVAPEPVTWLWHPYIPSGKVTLIEGDPGVGKTWLADALGTSITLGVGLPGMSQQEPRTVLLMSAEDGLGDTIRPRLDAMGADVSRVFAIEGAVTLDVEGRLAIEHHIEQVNPAVVFIDPFVAYIGARVDLHKANETREVLAGLAALATRQRCAVVLIRHLTKGSRDKSIYRGIGSIDITAACRSVLLVGADADDPNKRALVQVKNNLAEFGPPRGYVIRAGCFEWTAGVSDLTAQRILAPESDTGPKADAIALLRDLLAQGPVLSNDVLKHAKKFGISERTLHRAKTDLKITATAVRERGKVIGWEWSLPPGGELPLQEER